MNNAVLFTNYLNEPYSMKSISHSYYPLRGVFEGKEVFSCNEKDEWQVDYDLCQTVVDTPLSDIHQVSLNIICKLLLLARDKLILQTTQI